MMGGCRAVLAEQAWSDNWIYRLKYFKGRLELKLETFGTEMKFQTGLA